MSILTKPFFHDEAAAYAMLESILWPNGPICPHCGTFDKVYRIKPNKAKRVRIGLCKCGHCKKQFTVKVGTVFEQSHVPLNVWFQAAFLMSSSKKGISSNQLHRTLGVTLKTAWFMSHRLRLAMDMGLLPLGGEGQTVEIDETYVGGKEKNRHANKRTPRSSGGNHKAPVFALVERDGSVRAFHVPNVNGANLAAIVQKNVAKGTTIYSDENHTTRFAAHGYKADAVKHKAGEYVRGDVHTNTIENYFSILKRGIVGTFHHVSEQHLNRYLAEFDFRHNERIALGVDDMSRTIKALAGITGKRLTYRTTHSAGRA